MGHILTTPAGSYRANWRDPSGRQRAKTFKTKKAARAFLAEVESTKNRGSYVDPAAGRAKFGSYAVRWLEARNDEVTTAARDASIMRTHVLVQWGTTPLASIEHSAVQAWVTRLGERLSPATVFECHRLTAAVLRSAVRDRLIAANPCEGVRLPRRRKRDTDDQTISRDDLTRKLLPAVPVRYRALVALSAGTGLRWGECVGLRWDSLDLAAGSVRVVRVAIEVSGGVSFKPYPKSRAGRREVPLPAFAVEFLRAHRALCSPHADGLVFVSGRGSVLHRGTFRARVWRPSLVRAGLLGGVVEVDAGTFRATWVDRTGAELSKEFTAHGQAVEHVARHTAGGLRFHDLRHSYATWLVSDGVPVNDVQRVMGHEHASTTLDRYTHASRDHDDRVRGVFADFLLTSGADTDSRHGEGPSVEGP